MRLAPGAVVLALLFVTSWPIQAQPAAQWVEHLGLNVARAPLDNVILRQAIASAIDRRAVFDAAKSKFTGRFTAAAPAGSWYPPVLAQHRADVLIHPYDPTVARELLAKAGFPNGSGLPEFELLFRSDVAWRKAEADAVSAQLGAIGLKVKPVGVAGGTPFFSRVGQPPRGRGDYWMAIFAWGNPTRGSDFLSDMFIQGGPQNAYGYRNPDVSILIAEIIKEADQSKRLEKLREAERLILTDAPVVPLLYYYVAP